MLLILEQTLNGLQLGVTLFLMSAGLTLTFGIMQVINLAHGSFYMVGAYVAATVTIRTGSFLLGLVTALLAAALVGMLTQSGLAIGSLFVVRMLAPFVISPIAGVVADRESGQRLQAQLQPGQRLVTREGDLWRWDGFTARAEAPTAAAQRMAQRNRVVELRAKLEEVERLALGVEHAEALGVRADGVEQCSDQNQQYRSDGIAFKPPIVR